VLVPPQSAVRIIGGIAAGRLQHVPDGIGVRTQDDLLDLDAAEAVLVTTFG
jgi:hypothetical protein